MNNPSINVLIVEDQLKDREEMKLAVEECDKYYLSRQAISFDCVTTASAAKAKILKQFYDVVILDLQLESDDNSGQIKSGIEVWRELNVQQHTSYVILVTSYPRDNILLELFTYNADLPICTKQFIFPKQQAYEIDPERYDESIFVKDLASLIIAHFAGQYIHLMIIQLFQGIFVDKKGNLMDTPFEYDFIVRQPFTDLEEVRRIIRSQWKFFDKPTKNLVNHYFNINKNHKDEVQVTLRVPKIL